MPPARRQLRALGSLQLVGHANNPSKVITELAFITDAQANALEGGQSDFDIPLEVQFNEFMEGVNSRGKGTKTRQKKMTVEQAAAVLLVTVQKGHVELISKENDPCAIDVIKIMPEAKRVLATFLPKLRGYGNIPYDQQYRGAIALAKRHFFPKGKAPTKKELMALLLQSYQERRELSLHCQNQQRPLAAPTKTLGIQTSLACVNGPSNVETMPSCESAPSPGVDPIIYLGAVEISSQTNPESNDEPQNGDLVVDVQTASVTSEDSNFGNDDDHDMVLGSEAESARHVAACTPVALRSFNPYLTPESNPRNTDLSASSSPTLAIDSPMGTALVEDDSTDEGLEEMMQATATCQGRLHYYHSRLMATSSHQKTMETQKEEIQKKFEITRKKLDETEKLLREANADKGRLKRWGNALRHRLETIYKQLGILQKISNPETIENEDTSE